MSANKKRSVEDALEKTVKKTRRSCGKQTYKAKCTTSEEKDYARKCAEKFKADLGDEHPSFVRVMLPSHVSGGYWLGIPRSFRKKHLTSDKITMELIDENDVKYYPTLIGSKNGLSGGWMGFAKDHKLDEGDALVFELTGQFRFKVYIFKAREGQDSENSDKNDLESKKSDTDDGLDSTRPVKLTKVSASDEPSIRKPRNNVATVIPKRIQRTSSQKVQGDAPVAKLEARKSSSSTITSSQKAQGEAPKGQPGPKTKARKISSSKTRKAAPVKMLTRKVFSDTRFPGIRRS
ncbi:B3 domain-containing protein [Thalictrum thalictroides]|uniref:B3 domain-containing protein n=1 Tax=Thalictrum thalictroides TaxID=46969 RepID=A0A7J6UWL8_THATH|nr:B3 domain-containing protein [Thalictrum thalictroides]